MLKSHATINNKQYYFNTLQQINEVSLKRSFTKGYYALVNFIVKYFSKD